LNRLLLPATAVSNDGSNPTSTKPSKLTENVIKKKEEMERRKRVGGMNDLLYMVGLRN
jgi:hypothetical protein